MIAQGESAWKLIFGLVVALFFFCMGVAHVIVPDYFIKRSAIRKGGELLTESNRIGFQIVGIVVALFGAVMIYPLAIALFTN
jgi:hypothetical protein